MSDAEHLISAQQRSIVLLEQQIQELEKHVKDFEFLAKIWKDTYEKEVPKLKKKIATLEGVIEDLQRDLDSKK